MTQPFWQSDGLALYNGNVPDILKSLPDKSVHVIVTSPPYWGLRDYDLPASVWGGNPTCDHLWGDQLPPRPGAGNSPDKPSGFQQKSKAAQAGALSQFKTSGANGGAFCQRCGAWFGCLGLEPSPQLFVQHLVEIFHEARRVLRDDGTCWIVIGDSYAGSWGDSGHRPERTGTPGHQREKTTDWFERRGHPLGPKPPTVNPPGLKPKDLCMIPARVALALQDGGWWLRSDIIWAKGSCMPESVTDRPTSAHEHIFLLAKSQTYYYDAEAVKEPVADPTRTNYAPGKEAYMPGNVHDNSGRTRRNDGFQAYAEGRVCNSRNLRNVWDINPEPTTDKHYATFPTKLVKRCVLAGTSGRGCCPKCGKPWERVVERGGGCLRGRK